MCIKLAKLDDLCCESLVDEWEIGNTKDSLKSYPLVDSVLEVSKL
jgi:hypothetical protein